MEWASATRTRLPLGERTHSVNAQRLIEFHRDVVRVAAIY
jgi:hypothetical protein